eukprot:5388639-Prymnesium_polylepis.1
MAGCALRQHSRGRRSRPTRLAPLRSTPLQRHQGLASSNPQAPLAARGPARRPTRRCGWRWPWRVARRPCCQPNRKAGAPPSAHGHRGGAVRRAAWRGRWRGAVHELEPRQPRLRLAKVRHVVISDQSALAVERPRAERQREQERRHSARQHVPVARGEQSVAEPSRAKSDGAKDYEIKEQPGARGGAAVVAGKVVVAGEDKERDDDVVEEADDVLEARRNVDDVGHEVICADGRKNGGRAED